MDILPEDRALIPTHDPDVYLNCKWHLFISNLTEDVFQVLKDTFTMDCARTLKFQNVPEGTEPVSEERSTLSVPESDEVLKGSLLFFGY